MLALALLLATPHLSVFARNARTAEVAVDDAPDAPREVQFRRSGSKTWTPQRSGLVEGLEPGATYEFRARVGAPPGAWIQRAQVAMPPLPRSAPPRPQLSVLRAQQYAVSVGWLDRLEVIEIAARIVDHDWQLVALVPGGRGRFTAHILLPGTDYEFRARAWNQRGSSAWSDPVAATTLAYKEPDLDGLSPCVSEDGLGEAAIAELGEHWEECTAPDPLVRTTPYGDVELLRVNPFTDECNGGHGATMAAFASLAGCLRSLGPVPGYSIALAVPAHFPPLFSMSHAANGQQHLLVSELRAGRFAQVDALFDAHSTEGLALPWVAPAAAVLRGVPGAADLLPEPEWR